MNLSLHWLGVAPKYVMLFVAIVNGDVSLISFSALLSIVYRSATVYFSCSCILNDIIKFACKWMELEKKYPE